MKLLFSHRILIAILVLSSLLVTQGLGWGRVEEWNPDQMVFRNIFWDYHQPYAPPDYYKPPFHTYFSYFLAIKPSAAINTMRQATPKAAAALNLLWARLLHLSLFLGSVVTLYIVLQKISSQTTANTGTALFATSAGLHVHTRFLTADIPTMFWSMLAFACLVFFIETDQKKYLYWSSFLVGLATATKYNASLVLAGVLVSIFLKGLRNKKLMKTIKYWFQSGITSVFLATSGFIFGCPYVLLDFDRVRDDFLANAVSTPVFHGGYDILGYVRFFTTFNDVVGIPIAVLFAVGIIGYAYQLVGKKIPKKDLALFVCFLTIFVLHYAYFGAYSRLPYRFLIPLIPIMFVVAFNGIDKLIKNFPRLVFLNYLGIVILIYNVACAWYVGWVFVHNPRMNLQLWAADNISENSYIEKSSYTPSIALYTEKQIQEMEFPHYDFHFSENPSDTLNWYSIDSLIKRSPDYIVLDSWGYFYIESEKAPSQLRIFFKSLLASNLNGYSRVFYQEYPSQPSWSYPKEIDFVPSTITVLKRNDVAEIGDEKNH